MPRSYFRTLPDLYERKAFGTDTHPPYPPAALACFLGTLCFGEQQPVRGRFKSRRLLAVLLEGPRGTGSAMARQIPFLIKHGDLIELADGSLYVEGWDELQEGNWQVAERMQRYRDRLHAVTVEVTPDVTDPVTVDPSRVVARAVGGKHLAVSGDSAASPRNGHAPDSDDDEYDRVVAWLASRQAWMGGPRMQTDLARMVDKKGADAVIAAMSELTEAEEAAQFIYGARNALFPLNGSAVITKEAKALSARNSRRAELGLPPMEVLP